MAVAERKPGLQEPGDHSGMMAKRHHRTLWVQYAGIFLGFLLVFNAFTLSYDGDPMLWSDLGSGLLAILFSTLSLSPGNGWARWANVGLGIWLLFAPLVFWAPSDGAYLADTLAGSFLIAAGILVPGMPGMLMLEGPEGPPGWSYNPSSWPQRGIIIALGFGGFFLSRYMAAYQLEHVDSFWDPFTGSGSEEILDSDVSRAWPISDAGFGAMTYMLESLSGFMGGISRWRRMPWMVGLFGVLVVPLGVTSIVLIILQPLMVGTWCTLCLVTALLMLLMIPLALDEIVAMGQFMVDSRREGSPFWRTFFRGGTLRQHRPEPDRSTAFSPAGMVWGLTAESTLLLAALAGGILMFSPDIFGIAGTTAGHSANLVGALVVVVAIISLAEVARALRFVNVPLGAWLVVSPWLLGADDFGFALTSVVLGAAAGLLSLPRGEVRERYASWGRCIV